MSVTMEKYAEDGSHLKVPYVLGRFPQTDDELWWFVFVAFGVRIPRRAVCPGHVAPFRAFADAYFARSPVSIWKASRGFGGKTHLLSLLGTTELVSLGVFVTILGGSGAQSARVHESMVEFWDQPNAPKYLLSKDPTKFDTYLNNGGKARTLMASQKSVRGPHPQRMRLDEIDEMDLEILKAAQGQPMRSRKKPHVNTNTVMSSTHQYPNGTMTAMLEEAASRGWPVYHWCYKETSNPVDGWLTEDEIQRKREEVSEYMWSTEYELQEPSFEGRAIDTTIVDWMFDRSLGDVTGSEHDYYEFEPPQSNRDYVTGVDWAKEKDWTIITTFDTTEMPWRVVAWQRLGRASWPSMIRKANLRIKHYGGGFIHDSTGLGTVVKDYLELPPGFNKRMYKDQTLGGRERSEILEEYIMACENKQIVSPMIGWAYNEHKYATRDDIFGSGHLPDTICAAALAWHMRRKRKTPHGIGVDGVTRKSSPWKTA